MELEAFTDQVRALLDLARESLGRIEMHVRETEETPDLMEASRLYAQYCMHARDYLAKAGLGRYFPRRLAERVAPLRDGLLARQAAVDALGLRPTPDEFAGLVAAAEGLPGTA